MPATVEERAPASQKNWTIEKQRKRLVNQLKMIAATFPRILRVWIPKIMKCQIISCK